MKNVYLILGFLILGIILGNIGSRLIDSGIFVQWESLGSPPGGGMELAGTDGYRIFVRTKTDDVFVCSKPSPQTCWTPAAWPPDGPLQAAYDLEKDIFWVRKPPVTPIDNTAVQIFALENKLEAKYILSEDGTVWRWYYGVNVMSLQTHFFSFCGGSLGLLIGLLVIAGKKAKVKVKHGKPADFGDTVF